MKNDVAVIENCQVELAVENPEIVIPIIKMMSSFYEISERYEAVKFEYENAKYVLEKAFGSAFDSIGLKSIKERYCSATFVPPVEGKTITERKINERKLKALMEELGIEENEYTDEVEKTSGARKGYLKWKVE